MNKFHATLDQLPTMGVGFGFNWDLPLTPEDVARLRKGDLGGFDYIEIQTPHVLLFHDMWQIIDASPTVIHCSQFSLGSPRPREDVKFVELTRQVMQRARTPWFAEHISLSHFPGGDTRHFFLPYLDGPIAEDLVTNATKLQKLMGFPMLLENAPRLFDVTSAPINEGEFLSAIVNECNCGYLLDLSSARKTCSSLKYNLNDYLAKMPLDVLVELHVGDIAVERELAIELIRSCPLKAVTLEANLSKANNDELRSFVELINHELGKKSKGPLISAPIVARTKENSIVLPPLTVDVSDAVTFVSGTTISVEDDHFAIHSPGRNTTILPKTEARTISGMILGESLESMLDLSDPNLAGLLTTMATHGQRPNDRGNSGWKTWGLAEAFHRSIRSSPSTTFEGKEAFEARLSTPASQAMRPLFAKEYPLHPFFRLPPPGELLEDSLAVALLTRRTCRDFTHSIVPLQTISNVLYYSCGWTASGAQTVGGMPIIRRTSPSPGSMASIEAYLIAFSISGLVPGIYHYSFVSHGLELLDGENPSVWFDDACGDQSWVTDCSAAILLCGVPGRLAWKYPMPKGYQAMLMEVGHMSQVALLCATAEGLQCFCTGALREGHFEDRIGLEPLDETPLLIVGLGRGNRTL